MKYKIWDGKEELMTPIGEVLTAEQVKERYPAARKLKFIICDSPIQLGVFMEFTQTKAHYKKQGAAITDTMSEQETLDAITELEETPVVELPSAEERTAAAMEFSNILQMTDSTTKSTASEVYAKLIKNNVDKGMWTDQMIDIVSAKGMINTTQKNELKGTTVSSKKVR